MAPAVAGFYLSYRDPAHARAAYDPYRVTVIGSVLIKMQFEQFARNRNAQTCILFARRDRQNDFAKNRARNS
jgi:hypothetical protein